MADGEPGSSLLDGAWTLPNLVSAVRLAAIPWFWWVLLADDDIRLAAILVFVIGSTDWIDGYLARRLDQESELGRLLDPVADRAMIGSALVAGMIAGVMPLVIGIPLIVREVGMAGAAAVLRARTGETLHVRPLGKLATFLLYGAIPSFYLAAGGFTPWLFAPPAWIAGSIGLGLYWWVAFGYVGEIRGRLATP